MLNNSYRKKEKSSFKNEFTQESVSENSVPMFANSNNDTSMVVHNRELRNAIEQALLNIPEDYRMVFSLREMNGLNVAETSEMLNISEANVKVRLNRAKTMLRTELEKNYSAADLFEFSLIYCDAMVDRVMKEIEKL